MTPCCRIAISTNTPFSDYILYGNLKSSAYYALDEKVGSKAVDWSKYYDYTQQKVIVSAPSFCWFFASDCAQLYADVFRCPIDVYSENEFVSSYSALFFPLLETDKYHCTIEGSEATFPSPAILQRVGYNHFITFNIKNKKKKCYGQDPS